MWRVPWKYSILSIAIICAGCADRAEDPGFAVSTPWGAEPVRAQYNLDHVNLSVHWLTIDQLDNVRQAWEGADDNGVLFGFAIPDPAAGTCDVYVRKPELYTDPRMTILGHEVLHCLLGAYHQGHPTRTPPAELRQQVQTILAMAAAKATER